MCILLGMLVSFLIFGFLAFAYLLVVKHIIFRYGIDENGEPTNNFANLGAVVSIVFMMLSSMMLVLFLAKIVR